VIRKGNVLNTTTLMVRNYSVGHSVKTLGTPLPQLKMPLTHAAIGHPTQVGGDSRMA